jgi:hypothetical protein
MHSQGWRQRDEFRFNANSRERKGENKRILEAAVRSGQEQETHKTPVNQ